jgi:hypothetical protein
MIKKIGAGKKIYTLLAQIKLWINQAVAVGSTQRFGIGAARGVV